MVERSQDHLPAARKSDWSIFADKQAANKHATDNTAAAESPLPGPLPTGQGSTAAQPAPAALSIRLDPDVQFTPVEIGGVSLVRCVHHGTGMHFQFGAAEHHVAMLLDGTRSVSDIVQQSNADGLDWSPQDVADFVGVLVVQKIAIAFAAKNPSGAEVDKSLAESPEQVADAFEGAQSGLPSRDGRSRLATLTPARETEEVERGELELPSRDGRSRLATLTPERGTEEVEPGELELPSRDGRSRLATLTPERGTEEVEPGELELPSRDGRSRLATLTPERGTGEVEPGELELPSRDGRSRLATLLSERIAAGLPTAVKWCGYAFSLRFPLLHADPSAQRLLPIVRPLLAGWGMIASVAVILVSFVFATFQTGRLHDELMRIFDSNQWLVMLVAWVVLKVIHELGHACMARHYDVRVGRAGVMFFMFAPLAYVDVTDAWKLPRRRSRVAIALGGVYFELLCASLAVWVWWLFPGGVVAHVAAQVFFIAGPATLLVNANPLLRLDGYYVVSDLTDIPNLREQGRRLLSQAIERRLLGIQAPPSHLRDWRRRFAMVHAAASVAFQFVWMGGLVIVISMWAGPLGLLIAACAIFLWALLPTARWLVRMWMYDGSSPLVRTSHRRRMIWLAATGLTIIQFVVTLPSPFAIDVPAVVRYSGDERLRAPTSGFISTVYLTSGQTARSGEVILEIDNDELKVERDEIELQIQSESIQWQRNEHQRALGLAEAASQRRESLTRKLAELDEQVAAMKVKTTIDGEVLTPEIERLAGQYVNRGAELVQIGNRSRKELLLSIGDREMDAYRVAVQRGQPLRVFFRGGQRLDVVPQAMRPRGTRMVSHPALAATAGGPVPVSPTKSEQHNGPAIEWLTPRFEAIVELPPNQADAVRCGEVGMLALQDQRSLARRFWQWFKGDSAH